ncbi:MAG: methionyl-tRNA formyltransferase [Bryobacteraceae bacterium]
MRLIFLGTPQFAVPTLERIVEAGHQVPAVFTQPDRPKGRGRKNSMSPVKEAALRFNLPVHQPERIRSPEAIDQLALLHAEAMVVVGYGQIIPQKVIDLPPLGIINVHASLLPKYRGAAPVQWAVANGETETGVTTMRIDAGLDTGEMLLKERTGIGPGEDALQLGARLAVMGADLLVRTLDGLRLQTIEPVKQNPDEASYAPILRKEDGLIEWTRSASEIYNRSRGFLPWPGAYTAFRGQLLHIWKAKPANDIDSGLPGSIHIRNRRVLVVCGHETVLELLEVQLEGRKRVSAEAFHNGQRLIENEVLGEIKN